MSRAVAIARTAAISAFGAGARGLGHALVTGAALPGLPAETPLANPRARKMMSPAAYLAARCLADLLSTSLRDAPGELTWADWRERVGYYLGVGASAGSLAEFMALVDGSLVEGEYSLEAFGRRGLAACNPLLAFQLMNNFTMCHGAILEGLGGPNSAVFSRGAGTITALAEAVYAIQSGECDRAITGGADAPTHPATIAELTRDGFIARGMAPADGAGLIALEVTHGEGTIVEGCGIASGRGRSVADAMSEAAAAAKHPEVVDLVVIAPWGPPAADALRTWAAARCSDAVIVSTTPLGETVAASAALAVIAAADLLESSRHRNALVLTLGVDGDPGAVALSRGAA